MGRLNVIEFFLLQNDPHLGRIQALGQLIEVSIQTLPQLGGRRRRTSGEQRTPQIVGSHCHSDQSGEDLLSGLQKSLTWDLRQVSFLEEGVDRFALVGLEQL